MRDSKKNSCLQEKLVSMKIKKTPVTFSKNVMALTSRKVKLYLRV